MIILSIIAIGIGLSMDAFAVAVGKGLTRKKWNSGYALLIATFFGVFQAGMPLIGWLLASQIKEQITELDHWIAFLLLAIIGIKMIMESNKPITFEKNEKNGLGEIFLLAIATSIDAFAAGITFSLLGYNIYLAAIIIGVITWSLSLVGVWVGYCFGCRCKRIAELAGGIILVGIGLKILIEHLFF